MFDDETKRAIAQIAKSIDVPAAALLAVAEVESGGRVFAHVRGKKEPIIRYEGHYFDRFLKGDSKLAARAEGLSSPRAGAVKNPRSQSGRWTLLNRAIRINRIAALSSTSWGLGQVMGAHWQWLGYGSVDALVDEARSGASGQVALIARYIKKAGLVKALQERDWTAFARRYNGPAFHKHQYDKKMAEAFLRYTKESEKKTLPEVMQEETVPSQGLMFGSRGKKVRDLQKALTRLGYVLVSDGLFGLITDRVVRQFQRDHLLAETGIVSNRESDLIFGTGSRCVTFLKTLGNGLDGAGKRARSSLGSSVKSFKRNLRGSLLSISRRIN